MAKIRRGENSKCSLMRQWWANVPADQKEFILKRQKAFPFMRPCPKANGWWVRITAECDFCDKAEFTDK